MINLRTPLSFIASCVWNMAEYLHINLGRTAPYIFGMMIQSTPVKIKKEK